VGGAVDGMFVVVNKWVGGTVGAIAGADVSTINSRGFFLKDDQSSVERRVGTADGVSVVKPITIPSLAAVLPLLLGIEDLINGTCRGGLEGKGMLIGTSDRHDFGSNLPLTTTLVLSLLWDRVAVRFVVVVVVVVVVAVATGGSSDSSASLRNLDFLDDFLSFFDFDFFDFFFLLFLEEESLLSLSSSAEVELLVIVGSSVGDTVGAAVGSMVGVRVGGSVVLDSIVGSEVQSSGPSLSSLLLLLLDDFFFFFSFPDFPLHFLLFSFFPVFPDGPFDFIVFFFLSLYETKYASSPL
jgi:hypothetical protein